jgi:hypothetical protein
LERDLVEQVRCLRDVIAEQGANAGKSTFNDFYEVDIPIPGQVIMVNG